MYKKGLNKKGGKPKEEVKIDIIFDKEKTKKKGGLQKVANSNYNRQRSKKGNLMKKLFGTLGGMAGSYLGAPDIGKMIGQKVSTIFGNGDYQVSTMGVSNNSLAIGGMDPPQFANYAGGTVVKHREYIRDVRTGSGTPTAFTYNALELNPGIDATFPWLSQIATQYEEYRWLGMVWEFKTTSTDYASNSALGSVIMSTQYNALNGPFLNKQQQENYEFAQSIKPSQSCLHCVECKPSLTPVDKLYVRDGPVPSGGDKRLYDIGTFQISTVGNQAANSNIGELWVSYEIELYKPRLPVGGVTGDTLSSDYGMTSVSTAAPLGVNQTSGDGSTLPLVFSNAVGGSQSITFPDWLLDGQFQVTWSGSCTSGAITQPTVVPGTNCSFITTLGTTGNGYEVAPGTGATTTSFIFVAFIRVSGPSAVLTYSAAVLPTVSVCELTVAQLDPLQT
jgi:hypothetical protein